MPFGTSGESLKQSGLCSSFVAHSAPVTKSELDQGCRQAGADRLRQAQFGDEGSSSVFFWFMFFHFLKNSCYFPLLVLKGIYHYWKYVFFPLVLSNLQLFFGASHPCRSPKARRAFDSRGARGDQGLAGTVGDGADGFCELAAGPVARRAERGTGRRAGRAWGILILSAFGGDGSKQVQHPKGGSNSPRCPGQWAPWVGPERKERPSAPGSAGRMGQKGLEIYVGQNESTRGAQVLVHVSFYQGSTLGTNF